MASLLPLMKRHIAKGSLIFSDSHMDYCNLTSGTSRLSDYGFYHMWTNHSYRMVHEKFPFNYTLGVEKGWSDIKRSCYQIKWAKNYDLIQEYCNTYLSKEKLIKKRCLYDFTLKALHMYYKILYNQSLKELRYEEGYVSNLVSIYGADIYEIEDYKVRMKRKQLFCHQKYVRTRNVDIEDLSCTQDRNDFDPSFLRHLKIQLELEK